jgi:S-layer protein (TIGR01567 family)
LKKYTTVALIAFTVLITIAVNTASAAGNVCNSTTICNVVGSSYECNSWSNERYPVINLFGEEEVPLLANYNPIWKCHVNKLAKLVLDGSEKYTLKTGEILDLGHGYSIQAKQIDVDGKKVWLEFSKNGQYVDDQIVSTYPGDHNWTCSLHNIQGEDNIPVLKIHVNNVYQGANDSIVQIDGIWLIDYANARTLKIGDKIGNFTLEKIVSGVNKSNLGSLVFEKAPATDYICNVVGTNYKCSSWSNEQYPLINLFGEKNIPLIADHENIWNAQVNKFARLVLDSNKDYTLKTNEKLNLCRGYALKIKQIDTDSEKVWLELTKDGKHVADQNVSTNPNSNKTWNVVLDNVQGENNIVVMKVHVNNIFVGTEINVVRIDGIWLIDYANAKTLKIGDKIGKFTLEKIVSGTNSSNLGSLVFENITESPVSRNVVGTSYECKSWSNECYPLINLFGEKDVPLLVSNDPIWKSHVNKLAKLLLDSGEKYTMKTGESLDLGQGYSIQAKQIDIDGKKVWLEFAKNGKYVDDQIISTDTGGHNWTCSLDKIQGEDNIPVLKIHVNNVYQGAIDNIVQIDGIWLIDYANAKTLKVGNKVGEYTLEEIVSGVNNSNLGSLVFKKA